MTAITIPNITFAYNASYDLIFQELFEAKKKSGVTLSIAGVNREHYPSPAETKARMLEITNRQNVHGYEMLDMIAQALGVGRKENNIKCLVIGYCHLFGAMALPLTINSH